MATIEVDIDIEEYVEDIHDVALIREVERRFKRLNERSLYKDTLTKFLKKNKQEVLMLIIDRNEVIKSKESIIDAWKNELCDEAKKKYSYDELKEKLQ